MKIGITERGDATKDYSWLKYINAVDGAVLITKNVTDSFIDIIIPFRRKIILHATVTGYGGTKLEPNVMEWRKSIRRLEKLIDYGFPADHIVLRIDPIIPTEKGLALFSNVLREGYRIGLRRFKISVIDMYPHVRERFLAENCPPPFGDNFSASPEQFAAVDALVKKLQDTYPDARIECCAEPQLKNPITIGCVSNHDLYLLNLTPQEEENLGHQRKNCLCLPCKTELLQNKYRCPNGCLYCYWRDKGEDEESASI